MFIQTLVDRGKGDGDVGRARCTVRTPSGAAKRLTSLSVVARLFQPGQGRGCRIARRQHGVDHNHQTLGHVIGHLEVILHRLQGGGIPVQAMWPTRAFGNRSIMPSSMPLPARRIDTRHSFLPARMGMRQSATGVLTSTSCVGKSRVPHTQHRGDFTHESPAVSVVDHGSRLRELCCQRMLLPVARAWNRRDAGV